MGRMIKNVITGDCGQIPVPLETYRGETMHRLDHPDVYVGDSGTVVVLTTRPWVDYLSGNGDLPEAPNDGASLEKQTLLSILGYTTTDDKEVRK